MKELTNIISKVILDKISVKQDLKEVTIKWVGHMNETYMDDAGYKLEIESFDEKGHPKLIVSQRKFKGDKNDY